MSDQGAQGLGCAQHQTHSLYSSYFSNWGSVGLYSPLSGKPKALQGPREVSGQGCQKFTRGVLGSGAGEQEAVQVQVQGHLGHLGRTQVEVSEQSFIQHLGWERQRPSKF